MNRHDTPTTRPADADLPPLDELIPLADLPGKIPAGPGGRRLHAHVPYRWASKGLAGVVLRTVTLPGTGKVTTLDWYRAFVAEVAAVRTKDYAPGRRLRRRHRRILDRSGRTRDVLAKHGLADDEADA